MTKPKVLISILNWNAPASTAKTVESVLLSAYSNYKILLLDNNSTDNSVSVLKASFPDIELIKTKTNLGYAGAHKIAAKIAVKENYDLFWILNNDVEVFPFTLKELVLAYNRNGESILGSVTLEEDGKSIQIGGGLEIVNNVVDPSLKYNHYAGENFFKTPMVERPVSDLGGASIVIPVSIIRRYGFLDTRFFLYGEEVDYCYKLRKKFNIQSIIVPSAIVIHKSGASFTISPKLPLLRAYYLTRNCHLLNDKYPEEFKMERTGGLLHFLKYFLRHYFFVRKTGKNLDYLLKHYKKLGEFHAFIKLRGKYLEPDNFLQLV